MTITRQIFRITKNDEGDNWPIAWTGQDNDGNNYQVTTNNVHASELSEFTLGAEGDARLIAQLLNEYYAEHPQP